MPPERAFSSKIAVTERPEIAHFLDFFSQLQTAVAPLRYILSERFFIRKCRQFYSASFKKIKKGGTRFTFFAIFKKLK